MVWRLVRRRKKDMFANELGPSTVSFPSRWVGPHQNNILMNGCLRIVFVFGCCVRPETKKRLSANHVHSLSGSAVSSDFFGLTCSSARNQNARIHMDRRVQRSKLIVQTNVFAETVLSTRCVASMRFRVQNGLELTSLSRLV